METIRLTGKGRTKMIAHRGLSGIELENSYAAFVAAGNRDYFGVETDVHVTKDGQYAVFHDDGTGRICNADLTLEKSNFAQLRALKMREIGTAGYSEVQKIPSLSEYLRIMKRYEKVCVIELKNRMTKKDLQNIVNLCGKEYYLEKIIFISFDLKNLMALREMYREQKLQYLVGRYTKNLLQDLLRYSLDLDIAWPEVTKERVAELHRNGIVVNCWTCDSPETAQRLIADGVDMITTNILQ